MCLLYEKTHSFTVNATHGCRLVPSRQTWLKEGFTAFDFSFPDIDGTWCPNCVKRGIAVVSIQYERQTDSAFVRKVLTRFREKYDITYDQVFGGIADKAVVAKSLPALNSFLAFPTTIIIDKKGKVARIHTGYSGPATGVYYQEFVKEFNAEIDGLL